ncbi:MAG: periplasmic heavy metal sensor [Phycisphaerae bacterium]|jgi:Spy/CpxP family protein refolding chaperone|nr:periplasmic heavy metal sensor [Phycisphaerae bacterium]MBT5381548.1 periplasmic heavy metal sensor [Phycisphaerae bacterium]MBT5584161.1 periplasmic heavy metal sensor [Phycisphaerae bacterium]MBT5656915.1 periplasmic heavy metal sensor [Phycisphaerae bacterium]
MKIRILIALLALSVIFNIFFVAGAIQKNRPRPKDPVAEITRVANELSLDDQQAGRLEELRASYRADTELIRGELHEVRDAIGAEMASDTPDGTALRTLMERESTLIAKRREAAQQHFGHFVDLLTPEQRHHLGRRMHPPHVKGQGKDRSDRPPALALEQFDTDGDGELNASEREEAQRTVELRRGQVSTWREEMRVKFDEDQDGRLDAAEREKMRAWLLEQGFSPPTDGGRRGHRRGHIDPSHPDDGPPRRGGPRRGPRGLGEPPLGGPPPDGPPSDAPPPGNA